MIMSDQVLRSDKATQKSPPDMLGMPYWSANPVENGAVTILSVPIEYKDGKIIAGEYIGNDDPGEGSGRAMEIKDGHLVVSIQVNLPVGPHPINIRAKAADGTWSALESTVLTVMSTPVIAKDTGKATA